MVLSAIYLIWLTFALIEHKKYRQREIERAWEKQEEDEIAFLNKSKVIMPSNIPQLPSTRR
jgi:hypothetical protein